jgi:hypothetical protein
VVHVRIRGAWWVLSLVGMILLTAKARLDLIERNAYPPHMGDLDDILGL